MNQSKDFDCAAQLRIYQVIDRFPSSHVCISALLNESKRSVSLGMLTINLL